MKKQIKDMDLKELGGLICDALIAKDIHLMTLQMRKLLKFRTN